MTIIPERAIGGLRRSPKEKKRTDGISARTVRTSQVVLSCLSFLMALGLWALRYGPAESRPSLPAQLREPEVHYVTPRQLTDSAALAATTVPALTATTDRDQVFSWPLPDDRRPLLLVFIKEGCPCSVELEPFFHRLERAYADIVRFAGIIDADVRTARRYAEENAAPYPILADPERQISRRFRAENGAYVALVALSRPPVETAGASTQDCLTIDSLWPGCSAEMFIQMGRRIAAVAGVAERALCVSDLPSASVTGCPFEP